LNNRVAAGKTWKLVVDKGVRWNSSYLMIRRAFELQAVLNVYTAELSVSKEDYDSDVYNNDFLTSSD